MVDNEKQADASNTDKADMPEKKGLKSLLAPRKLVIAGLVLVMIGGAAGGWMFMKKKKNAVKKATVATETPKPPLKITSDYFDHIVILGPYEIRLTQSGTAKEEGSPEAGTMVPEGSHETSDAGKVASVSGENAGHKEGQDAEKKDGIADKATEAAGHAAVASGTKTLKIQIAVEMNNPEMSREIITKLSMIDSDIQEFLKNKSPEELQSEEGQILLKNELIANLNKTLDSGKVRDMYFTIYFII